MQSRIRRATGWSLGTVALLALATAQAQQSPVPAATSGNNSPGTSSSASTSTLDEIVVTAQRRSENLRDVPISISVIGGDDLEKQHVPNFDAITRMSPGVSFSAGAGEGAGEGQETVEIRGVSSNVGAATVGIYLDDMPITLPGEVGTSQPKFFDMERLEVLRGPQGTLYGSSSEGGTLRFITKPADLHQFSSDVSAEVSGTQHGGVNTDARGVVNVPLVDKVFAVRLGVQFAADSGWIDRYAHPAGYQNLTTSTGQKLRSGVNGQDEFAVKLAAKYQPSDDLTVTPLIYYQKVHQGDQSAFFLGQAPFAQENSVNQPVQDAFSVTSVKVEKKLSFADLTSNTGYYYKDINREADGTYYDPAYVVPALVDPAYPLKAAQADPLLSSLPTTAHDHQTVSNWVQELRLASKPHSYEESPLTWVGGVYLSRESYRLQHKEVAPGWNQLFNSVYGFSPNDPVKSPVSDTTGATPNLWANDEFQHNLTERQKNEYAIFGQADYDVTRDLHVGVGARYDWARLPYERYAGGFFNLGNAAALTAVTHEHALTPKVSVRYDTSELSNVYASVAKGFRVGGVNNPVPYSICAGDYKTLGIAPEPASYTHDSLWTQELGSKSALLSQSVSINAALYQTHWNNIQQQINLPTCGYAYVSNVGDARIRGGELDLRYKVAQIHGLSFGLSGSVQQTRITAAFPGSPATVGQHILYTPSWNAAFAADYAWQVSGATNAFVHSDVNWTGSSNGSFQTSSPDYNDPSYAVVNASAGVDFGSFELNFFGTNMLNNSTIIKHPQVNLVIEAYTVQPRTMGIRFVKHVE